MMLPRYLRLAGLPLLLCACSSDGPAPGPARVHSELLPAAPATSPAASSWRSADAGTEGVALRESADTLQVTTGPHAVLWPAAQRPLVPPYAVEATFLKREGRLYEGYGIVIGGSALELPESQQTYSYVLLRGDGAYLVKRREREETPIVRSWTAHAAVARDRDGAGQPNRLRLEVDSASVEIIVNGVPVASVPAAELHTEGLAGVRIAHDVSAQVIGFAVRPLVRRAGAGR